MVSDENGATTTRGNGREGWQGRRASVSYTAPQYRWQGGGGMGVERRVSMPRRRQRWWIIFWLFVLWGLFGVYVALLAYSPRRVPLVAVVATEYDLPLPPNAWATEDLELIRELNEKKNETIWLLDTSSAWKSRSTGLEAWKQRIQDLIRHGSPSRVALFYVSMHGATDERGRACLIPPGVAPLDSQQWIPVEDFLRPLADLPANWHKVVFLDATRQSANWQLGIVENTFSDRLPDSIKAASVPGLCVINSSGPEQINWSSPDLGGSIFGRHVALGLAGAADHVSRSAKTPGGNGDGRVAIDELQRYLETNVRRWSRRNRAAAQVPRTWPESPGSYPIAKALYQGDVVELKKLKDAKPRETDSVSPDDIAALWRQVDAVRGVNPYQGDPLAWRDLEQRLLWLEQLATSGKAYQDRAQKIQRDLTGKLERAVKQAAEIADRPALAARVAVLDEGAADWSRRLSLRSLPLCEYFGVVDAEQSVKLRQHLDELASSVDEQQFEARFRAALRTAPRPEVFEKLVEVQSLRIAQQYRVADVWHASTPLQRLLELRERADRLTTGVDERAHYWTRREWQAADGLRRQAEDRLFAGPDAAGPEPWQPALAAYEHESLDQVSWTSRIRAALDVRDRALAELPYLARLYASSEPLGKPVAGTEQDKVPAEVASAIAAVLQLGRQLDSIPLDGLPEAESNRIGDLANQLATQLKSLREAHEAHCRRLLAVEQVDPAALRGLELTLQSPLVPADLRVKARQRAQGVASQLKEFNLRRELGQLKPGETPKSTPILEGSRDRLQSWPAHPLLSLLEIPQGPPVTTTKATEKPDSATDDDVAATAKPSDDEKSQDGDEDAADSRTVSSSATATDFLARWELQAANVRQRLVDLSLWTPTGAMAASTADANGAGAASGAANEAPANVAKTAANDTDSGDESLVTAPQDSAALARGVRDAREELSRAASRLRAAAALGVPVPAPARNSVRLLRHFDLQQLLLMQARRALDDFWGAGRRKQADAPPESAFFAQAVRDHLRAANLIVDPPPMFVQGQVAQIQTRLEQRLSAIRGAIDLQVVSSDSSDSADLVRFRVQVTEATGKLAIPGAAAYLPVGEATAFARQGDEILLEAKRALLSLPPAAGAEPRTVEAKPSEVSGAGLQAGLVFRGHEFSQPLVRRGFGGVLVRYEPTVYDSAQVTLFGKRSQQASVMFVLDCSSSMSRDIFVEAIGAAEQQQARLDVAKSVLQEFLEQIAERGDMRVGARFFGHRVGWTRSQPVKVLAQTDYLGGIPNELPPAEDVELVLPLGRFGPVEAGKVVRLLPSLKPWGQSPLYLSLLQAMSDFDNDRGDTDRSIVVITDGGNYQFTPDSQNVRARPSTTMQQVLAAWRGRNIPIHIVGFGIDEDAPDIAAVKLEFDRITSTTGGQYVPVQSGQDLMRVLRSRLGVGAYRVTDERGVSAVRTPGEEATSGVRLNQPVRIAGLGAGPRKYRVEFESLTQPVVLEGGERVDFDVTPDNRLTMRAFDANVVATLPLVSGGRRVLARVHRPVSDRDGTTFRVSLQDENLDFLPRPDEVWIEITPIEERKGDERKQETPPTYVFYERNFEPQMPVPVVVCRTPRWPAAARSARIQVWCKFTPSPPVMSRPLEQIARLAGGDDEPTPGVQGIRLQYQVVAADASDGLTELRVTERHADGAPDVDALRVQIAAPVDLWPRRVERQADAAAGLVVHSFFVPRERWLRMTADARVRLVVTTKEATRDGAFLAEGNRAATVEVTPASDTLPIQPPRPRPGAGQP